MIMEKIYDSQHGQVFQGDCLEAMKSMPDNSVETCITDPPAGIGFMNKSFDSDMGGFWEWVNYYKERFQEVLRILKPGGLAFVWAIPQTAHWTACALMFAGFGIRAKAYHLFGAVWPKGLDISKGIDEHFGCKREKGELKVYGNGTNAKPFKFNMRHEGYRRPWMDLPAEEQNCLYESEPVHPLAKEWNGWNTQLKPMCEEWVVAMKPTDKVYWNELRDLTGLTHWVIQIDLNSPKQKEKYGIPAGTKEATIWKMKPLLENESFMDVIYIDGKQQKPFNIKPFKPWFLKGNVENALKWGVSGFNIDGCRIPIDKEKERAYDQESRIQNPEYETYGAFWNSRAHKTYSRSIQNTFNKGRYPGNVIIDGEVAGDMDEKYGIRHCGKKKSGPRKKDDVKPAVYGDKSGNYNEMQDYGDGGASRFFTQCEYFFSGKTSQSEKNIGLGEEKCEHPTVKNLALMRWLCRLSKTPKGGTVIDPFAGTFSTLIAAYLEGRKFIAIEHDPEYVKIGMARLKEAMGMFFKENLEEKKGDEK